MLFNLKCWLDVKCLIEFWLVEFINFIVKEKYDFVCYVWMRVWGEMFEDCCWYDLVLVYVIDFNLLIIVLFLYGLVVDFSSFMLVSLDYFMWFYCFFWIDDWLLYVLDSLFVLGVCGFMCGKVFIIDGELVVSVM